MLSVGFDHVFDITEWISGEEPRGKMALFCRYNCTKSGNIQTQHANSAVSSANCLKMCLVGKTAQIY